jgi:hypothetical protein
MLAMPLKHQPFFENLAKLENLSLFASLIVSRKSLDKVKHLSFFAWLITLPFQFKMLFVSCKSLENLSLFASLIVSPKILDKVKHFSFFAWLITLPFQFKMLALPLNHQPFFENLAKLENLSLYASLIVSRKILYKVNYFSFFAWLITLPFQFKMLALPLNHQPLFENLAKLENLSLYASLIVSRKILDKVNYFSFFA